MMFNDCRDCKYYDGDCGHHHIDYHKHIHYDIPSEVHFDIHIGEHGDCFEPNEEYQNEQKENLINEMIKRYTADELQMALSRITGKEHE